MVAILSAKVQKSYTHGYYFVPVSNNLFEIYPEIKDDEIKVRVVEAKVNGRFVEDLVGKEFVLKVESPFQFVHHLVLPEDMLKIMREYNFPDKFYLTLELLEGLKSGVKIFPKGKVTIY